MPLVLKRLQLKIVSFLIIVIEVSIVTMLMYMIFYSNNVDVYFYC